MRVLPGEEARARRRTEWRGHEGIAEHRAFTSYAIDVWSFYEWMTRDAQFIPTQIVYKDEYDVRPRCSD